MKTEETLRPVQDLLATGQVEQALEQLVAFLDTDPRYEEFAQTTRLAQGDFYQTKSQYIRGIITAEDVLLANNKSADKAMQIIALCSAGKFSFSEAPPVVAEQLEQVKRTKWKYYLGGGIAALVLFGIFHYFFNKDTCPNFGSETKYRILILPLRQTGDQEDKESELEIMDKLNVWFDATPSLKKIALADVKESDNTEENYPNPIEAIERARECGATMVVFGKANKTGGKVKLDIQYRFVTGNGANQSVNPSADSLLQIKNGGEGSDNPENIAQLLYLALANQARVRVSSAFLASLEPNTATFPLDSAGLVQVDTSFYMELGNAYALSGKNQAAVEAYTKVLDVNPTEKSALHNRGYLLYKQKDYAGAARDLEASDPSADKTNPEILKIRTDAYLRSGQPEKAQKDLKTVKSRAPKDQVWIETTQKSVNDSLIAAQVQRDRLNVLASSGSTNQKLRVSAAKSNLQGGDASRAIKNADVVLKRDPKNTAAIQVKVEAQLVKGDTTQAEETMKKYIRSGGDARSVIKEKPVLAPLILRSMPKN